MTNDQITKIMDELQSNCPPTHSHVNAVHALKKQASDTATEKGFWDGLDVDERFAEAIALIHSELSEALEAHRNERYGGGDGFQDDTVSVELADTVIRILDLADKLDEKHGSCFEADLGTKMIKNKSREYKHGKQY